MGRGYARHTNQSINISMVDSYVRVIPHFTNIIKCDHCENLLADHESMGTLYYDSPVFAHVVAEHANDLGWLVRYDADADTPLTIDLTCPECHGGPIGS